MSSACSEVVWLCKLLHELGFSQSSATPLHADNSSVCFMSAHVDGNYHYIREAYEDKIITLHHVTTAIQM